MIVKPFRGLRPRADLAHKIPSCPYDVLSTEEARRLAGDDPYSFLHVIRPEIDLDAATDPHAPAVYARGRENFRSMIERGWLVRDERPAFYVYRLTMTGHTQTGVMCAAAVDDYLEGRIKKHEHTRPDKEQDRVQLIDALSAHPGPVFLTYRGRVELDAAVGGAAAADPQVRFTADDGVEHALWVVDAPERVLRIEELFGEVPSGYVADGHHRAAAASRVCAQRMAALQGSSGNEACRYFLAVYFPAAELRVLDYNRVVKGLNGLAVPAFLDQLGVAGFDVEPGHRAKKPPRRGTFGMYLAGRWFLLTPRSGTVAGSGVLDGLDVAILADRVLKPILGIDDPRTDRRIDFVGGIRGVQELERRVDSGEYDLAFALYPTSLEEVMQVADAGQVMPPKSTWFEPKLRSGLVVQPIDGDAL